MNNFYYFWEEEKVLKTGKRIFKEVSPKPKLEEEDDEHEDIDKDLLKLKLRAGNSFSLSPALEEAELEGEVAKMDDDDDEEEVLNKFWLLLKKKESLKWEEEEVEEVEEGDVFPRSSEVEGENMGSVANSLLDDDDELLLLFDCLFPFFCTALLLWLTSSKLWIKWHRGP